MSEIHAGTPARQGFYRATLQDGRKVVAEWKEREKRQGKVWWEYRNDSPTEEKTPRLLDGVVSFQAATKQEVAGALKREPTEAERIAAAYESFVQLRSNEGATRFPVSENRKLLVGMPVEYGTLKDCEVVSLHQDGEVAVLRYHNIREVYGKLVDGGIAYIAVNADLKVTHFS